MKLSPRVRSDLLDNGAIASIPLNLIGPFLNEAVVLDSNELESAPRIVATQEGRVMVSRGETAYVRGDLAGARDFRLFREPRPLVDPLTRRRCWALKAGLSAPPSSCAPVPSPQGLPVVPATFTISSTQAGSRRR